MSVRESFELEKNSENVYSALEKSIEKNPLLERVFIFLEDSEWEHANEYCERVLDCDPKNATAYIGKLMAELHVRSKEDLAKIDFPFDQNKNYLKAIRFGNDEIIQEHNGYLSQIHKRIEDAKNAEKYNQALQAMDTARSEKAFLELAEVFNSIKDFKNSAKLANKCQQNAEICRKVEIYNCGILEMQKKTIEGYEKAIKAFSQLAGWRDTNEKIDVCQQKINNERKNQKKENNRHGFFSLLKTQEDNNPRVTITPYDVFSKYLDYFVKALTPLPLSLNEEIISAEVAILLYSTADNLAGLLSVNYPDFTKEIYEKAIKEIKICSTEQILIRKYTYRHIFINPRQAKGLWMFQSERTTNSFKACYYLFGDILSGPQCVEDYDTYYTTYWPLTLRGLSETMIIANGLMNHFGKYLDYSRTMCKILENKDDK